MLNIILIALAVIVVLFTVIVATRPADFRVTRTGRISAPVEVVFENVNTLRKWEAWSPWAKMDPNAKSTFSGPESGPGSSMTWSGNNKVGEGRMTITDFQPNQALHIKLEFLRPMKATNMAEFLFKADGNQTTVTWSMTGKNNFIGKAFHLMVNCDKMIGRDFEKGLANLNSATQQMAHT
jgi:uncharacterized protein YndB with AHSA1/START domain